MTVQEFRDLLAGAGVPVFHYAAAKPPDRFIRWTEYATRGKHADNRRGVLLRRVQADLFTKTEYDPLTDALCLLLEGAGVAFDGPDTDYEEDTGFIHHWWDCSFAEARDGV